MLDEKRGYCPRKEEEYSGRFSEASNKLESTFRSHIVQLLN